METINGRFFPDDSDRKTPQSALQSQPQRKAEEDSDQTPPSTGPVSKRARLKRPSADGGESKDDRKRGSVQDRYVELGELGRGGWGIVQRALDRQLQREVAVKRISNPGKIRAAEREQFLHEARITSGLQHPGVVPVHELVSDADGDTYYVMKLLEGDTLRHHIRLAHANCKNGKWKRHELLEAITPLLLRFIDVCHAVAYAHRCGIIHRDLKPANVMAGAFGETIVVDWGLARYIDDKSDESTIQGPTRPGEQSGSHRSSAPMESEGSVIGTPTYMSPEQARGELASLGSHSDIYSLGVILYEIVAGHHPHKGLDIKSVLRRARQGEFESLSAAQPSVPKSLESIVHTAMSPDADKRYQDVEALADDVGRFMTGQQVTVHRENFVERSLRWCNRHRAIASTIGIAVTVLMIVSVISTVVIRSAHQSERLARIEAAKAHHEALERLVDARDTADTWLVDLSGSLQYHPAMTPLRRELIGQALIQYERLIEFPIAPITSLADSELSQDAYKTRSLEWLERAKCHMRLGDLKRMSEDDDEALGHYLTAESILEQLQRNVQPETSVSLVSARGADPQHGDWIDRTGQLADFLQIEQINAKIGKTMATNRLPTLAEAMRCREQLQQWIPLEPPADSTEVPSEFVSRAISALVRLELVVQRIGALRSNESQNVFSPERYKNAVRWARWLAHERGKPNDLKLYDTIAAEHAGRHSGRHEHASAHQAWTNLINEFSRRLEISGDRSDWMQSLAHAKIRRAESAVHLGLADEAAHDYRNAISDLQRTWALADADEFFRVNLATAENNLGRLWSRGDSEQRQAAIELFKRSIATYQQLLSESATPDILRRLAQTHIAMSDTIGTSDADQDAGVQKRHHLDNANLAYEILADQDLLTGVDRLDWATVLVAINQMDPDADNHAAVAGLIGKIDVDKLTAAQKARFRQLQDSGAQ